MLMTKKQKALFENLPADEKAKVEGMLDKTLKLESFKKDPDSANNGLIAYLQNYRMSKLTDIIACEKLKEDEHGTAVRVTLRVRNKRTVAHLVVPGRTFEQARMELKQKTGAAWHLIESSAESIYNLCVER